MSYYPGDFRNLSRNQKAHGIGDVIILVEISGTTGEDRRTTEKEFRNIRNVKEVERMLQELKKAKSPDNDR
jgi:hypothetical protein